MTFDKWIPEIVTVKHDPTAPPMHRDYRPYPGKWLEPEIDPTARIERSALIEHGIEKPTRIGRGSWVFNMALVGHDAQIGENCEIATRSLIGGHCVIGNNVKIGMGSIIRPRITVGDGARTGCGAVVVEDIQPGEVWVGNPARRLVRAGTHEIAYDEDVWERIREEAEGLSMWSEWWRSTRA